MLNIESLLNNSFHDAELMSEHKRGEKDNNGGLTPSCINNSQERIVFKGGKISREASKCLGVDGMIRLKTEGLIMQNPPRKCRFWRNFPRN